MGWLFGDDDNRRSWLDSHRPGRRTSNNVQERNRRAKAQERKNEQSKPPEPKKNTWSLW